MHNPPGHVLVTSQSPVDRSALAFAFSASGTCTSSPRSRVRHFALDELRRHQPRKEAGRLVVEATRAQLQPPTPSTKPEPETSGNSTTMPVPQDAEHAWHPLGMLATASSYAGYPRQCSDEMVRRRSRAPAPICPCRTADASTRIWPFFSSRTSLISRPAFTRFPPIMTDRC